MLAVRIADIPNVAEGAIDRHISAAWWTGMMDRMSIVVCATAARLRPNQLTTELNTTCYMWSRE